MAQGKEDNVSDLVTAQVVRRMAEESIIWIKIQHKVIQQYHCSLKNKTEQNKTKIPYNIEKHKTPTIQGKNFQESETPKSH